MPSAIALRRGLDDYLLCRKVEDCVPPGGTPPTPKPFREVVSTLSFLQSCVTNPDQERKLRLWLEATGFASALQNGDILQNVANLVVSGKLTIAVPSGNPEGKGIIRSEQAGHAKARRTETTPLQDEMARQQQSADADEIVLGEPEPEPEKTWIEIELIDDNGRAVPDERYKLTLPDGSVKWGRLDGEGKARVERLQPGTCQVTFPDRDQQVWDVG